MGRSNALGSGPEGCCLTQSCHNKAANQQIPEAKPHTCMSAMAFLTVKLRSWSRAGTAARTNSCRHGRSTSGWWATMRRESLMASCWPCRCMPQKSEVYAGHKPVRIKDVPAGVCGLMPWAASKGGLLDGVHVSPSLA
eukprot:1159522-Pelagomonas_calceolata.AAC.11